MPQSPSSEVKDPMVGQAGTQKTVDPKQHTAQQQREGEDGKDAPKTAGQDNSGATSAAVQSAEASVKAVEGEAGGQSRKEVETGTKSV
ncbi:hypothetical protein P7C73_g4275, partial [Tremellales sp. Uapishka_1]